MIKRIGTDMAEAWMLCHEMMMGGASDVYIRGLGTGGIGRKKVGDYTIKFSRGENCEGLKPGYFYVERNGAHFAFNHHGYFLGGLFCVFTDKDEIEFMKELKRATDWRINLKNAYADIEELKKHDSTVATVFNAMKGIDLGDAAPYVFLCSCLLKEKKDLMERLINQHLQRKEM